MSTTKNRILRTVSTLMLLVTLVTFRPPLSDAYEISQNGNRIIVTNMRSLVEYSDMMLNMYPAYRPVWFNAEHFTPDDSIGSHAPDSPHVVYGAVLEENTEGVPVAHWISDKPGILSELDAMKAAGGWDMIQLESFDVGNNQSLYCLTGYHRPGPDWEVIVGVDGATHDLLESLLPASLNIVNETYSPGNGGSVRTSLYKADLTETVFNGNVLTFGQYQNLRASLEPQGYRVTSSEVMNSAFMEPRYVPVFKRNGNLMFTYTYETYAQTIWQLKGINEGAAWGMAPVIIAAQDFSVLPGWGTQAVYMAEWRQSAIVAEWVRPPSGDLTDKPNPTHGDPPSGLRETTHEPAPSTPALSRSKDR